MKLLSELNAPYGLDMWDGYPVDRERVYDAFRAAKARPIVISGDSHAFWCNELKDKAGRRVACEFGGTAVTSGGADTAFGFPIGPSFAKASDEVVFCDQGTRGFVLMTLTREAVTAEMMGVSTITAKTFTTRSVKTYRVTPDGTGVSGLKEV
jgi:alkaline phosphatase D